MRDTADETAMYRRRTAMLVITALAGMVVMAAPVLQPLWLLVFKDEEFNSGWVVMCVVDMNNDSVFPPEVLDALAQCFCRLAPSF